MPKFYEVFEFEGQKYVKSERASSEVKVGDIVRIREDIPSSIHWASTARRSLGTIQKVTALHENMGATFDCISGLWSRTYLEILEPATKTTPRPHAELIKQWAEDDSLEVQVKTELMEDWSDITHPSWCKGCDYRFKPKTVPAWQVLYEDDGMFILTLFHYKTEDEFNSQKGGDEKFIRFILETEKQVQA
jgi:hypothetical protein